MTRDEITSLKSSFHLTFESPQGQEVMAFIEKIGSWYPTVMDSMDTNEIIARDANRRLIGTIKTILGCTPEQIQQLLQED